MAARNFKTTKGTELPLLSLRGKEYLEVKYRLVWFREDHPDWSIETELVSVTDVSAYAKATVKDERNRIMATSHKFESMQGFPDFIEKAETGAIGRALALIGYGTQFCADELDEGTRLVDAPIPIRPGEKENLLDEKLLDEKLNVPTVDPGEYLISFGRKYKGRKLKDIPKFEIESYIDWLEKNVTPGKTALSQQAHYLRLAYQKFYGSEGSPH